MWAKERGSSLPLPGLGNVSVVLGLGWPHIYGCDVLREACQDKLAIPRRSRPPLHRQSLIVIHFKPGLARRLLLGQLRPGDSLQPLGLPAWLGLPTVGPGGLSQDRGHGACRHGAYVVRVRQAGDRASREPVGTVAAALALNFRPSSRD